MFPMEALSTYTGDESNCLGSIEEEAEEDSKEEEENEQEEEEEDEQGDDTKEPRKGETKLCTHCRFQSLTSQAGPVVECRSHPGRLIDSLIRSAQMNRPTRLRRGRPGLPVWVSSKAPLRKCTPMSAKTLS